MKEFLGNQELLFITYKNGCQVVGAFSYPKCALVEMNSLCSCPKPVPLRVCRTRPLSPSQQHHFSILLSKIFCFLLPPTYKHPVISPSLKTNKQNPFFNPTSSLNYPSLLSFPLQQNFPKELLKPWSSVSFLTF